MVDAILSRRIMAGLFCVVLSACGGGGGDGGAVPQSGTTGASASPDTPGVVTTGSGATATPGATGAGQQGTTQPPATPGTTTGDGSSAPSTPTTPTAESDADDTGGTPAADATQARFRQPLGIAIDEAGNLYVADSGNHTIRRIAATGVVTTIAGSPGASGTSDGTGAGARFSALRGISVDAAGNLYAIDNSAVRKITPAGVVSTLAGVPGVLGDADGSGATARFRRPWGVAVDGAGNVFVADTENALVRRIAPDGTVSTHAGTRGMRGRADGSTATATFLGPVGLAADPAGNLYLTDWFGPPAPNIPEGSTFVRRIGTDGGVSTVAGTLNGEAGPAAFMDTFAIAADGSGNVFVAALGSVRRISPGGAISTVAGPSSPFQSLEGLTIDGSGNLFVTDASSHTISRVTQGGDITLVAGRPGEAGSANAP